jgi:uncharacterized caspase-like protein
MEISMNVNRIRILTNFLFMFMLFSLLVPISIQGSSRGIAVISDLSHQSGKLGAYRALIVGINDYKDPKIPDLETAVNDANAMAELLRKRYGFQVELLLDRKATKEAIYRALRDLASSTKSDDSVLIYYAGHGDLDRTYNDGWWIPADAKGGNPVTYLDNVQVQKSMRSMKARHVLLISDSCYSGTLFGKARAMPQVIDNKYYLNLYNEKSRWGMTSGNKTPVSDAGSGGHSVFAYQLLKELEKNEKPYISTQELYTRIAPIVSNNSEQTPLCRPVRHTGDQGGEFIFVTSKSTIDIKSERANLEQERLELERIKTEIEREKIAAERKQLEEERRALRAKRKREKNLKQEKVQSKELAYMPKAPAQVKPDSRLAVAIFPSKIYSGVYEFHIIREVKNFFNDHSLYYPKYSYYDLGPEFNEKLLDSEILPPNVIKNLRIKKSFFERYKPNIELICNLGKQLQVDLVLFFYLGAATLGTGDYPGDFDVFLINVKTKKLYSERYILNEPSLDSMSEEMKMQTKKVFDNFEKTYQ